MSFLDTIEHLQNKPPAVRRRVLVITVTGVMAVIVAVWLTNLRTALHPGPAASLSINPFTALRDIVRDSAGSVKNQFEGASLDSIKNLKLW